VRLALLAALLLCLIQLVLSAAFYTFTSNWLFNQLDQSLMTTAAQVAAALDDGEPLEADDFGMGAGSVAFLRERRSFIRVIDLDTGAILDTNDSDGWPVTAQARNGRAGFETLNTPSEEDSLIRIYTLPFENSQQLGLQIGQSLEETHRTLAQILGLLALMLGATALLALASGWFLAHRALIPVIVITRTAREIGENDLSRRIAMNLPDDELGQLARTINAMLDRIEQAFQQQQRFTGDAAHELRTPLSIMQTGIDVTLSQERSPAYYRTTLESIQEEVRRLTALTVNLLTLARADAHLLTLNRRPMDLSLLVNTVLEQLAPVAEQKHVTVRRDIAPHVSLVADEDCIIQLALNLIQNGVKYTPEGGCITIIVSQTADEARLIVTDTGPGIPVQHLAHIFDRFYRIDRARSREHGGFGLGLAIAQQIVHLHGGEIEVASEVGVGTRFTVTLPAS
jgi:heavy metal sensor kinase